MHSVHPRAQSALCFSPKLLMLQQTAINSVLAIIMCQTQGSVHVLVVVCLLWGGLIKS
jgi:hypothetical protein